MNPQLAAMFAAHKTAIFGAAAAGVVGLALLQKKKAAGTKAGAATSSIPGTLPAAVVAGSTPATGGGTYDSSSYDLYNALQPEIEQLLQTQGGSVTTAPAPGSSPLLSPIASTLTSPTGSGQLVRYGTAIDEVESDGSLYHLSLPEWGAMGSPMNFVQMGGANPTSYTGAGNLATKIAKAPKA